MEYKDIILEAIKALQKQINLLK